MLLHFCSSSSRAIQPVHCQAVPGLRGMERRVHVALAAAKQNCFFSEVIASKLRLRLLDALAQVALAQLPGMDLQVSIAVWHALQAQLASNSHTSFRLFPCSLNLPQDCQTRQQLKLLQGVQIQTVFAQLLSAAGKETFVASPARRELLAL